VAGQPADNWFVIDTTSRTTVRKLVKNLKYAKTWLVFGTVEDIRSNKIFADSERSAS